MTGHRVIWVILGMGLLSGCATDYAPNDSASRGLNEMKARNTPVPPKPDPRDIRIAELERTVAVASNSTSEGRQKNRHVEIVVKQ